MTNAAAANLGQAAGDGMEAVADAQIHSKIRSKKAPKRVLALPDLEQSKAAVLNSLTSASGERTYDHAIREFVACTARNLASRSTARS
jgi:hypothetical protein